MSVDSGQSGLCASRGLRRKNHRKTCLALSAKTIRFRRRANQVLIGVCCFSGDFVMSDHSPELVEISKLNGQR
jgi:hypothetical protein